MKQRTEHVLQQKGRDWGEVKLGEGSIRDVEFVVQYLQLAHGNQYPDLHGRATLQILPRLAHHRLLTNEETRILDRWLYFNAHHRALHSSDALSADIYHAIRPDCACAACRTFGFQDTDALDPSLR